MPKLPSKDLHELIHSMTKNEKRYFLLKNKEKGENLKILTLYHSLDKNKNYDEEVICKENPELKSQQLPNLKRQLYFNILKTLRNYSLSSHPSLLIRELIDESEILFNKNLYAQSTKRLNKAEKMATKLDNLEIQLEILKQKKNLLTHTFDSADPNKRADDIVKKVSSVSKQINNINVFSNLRVQLQSQFRQKGYIKNDKNYKKIQEFFYQHLPKLDSQTLSVSEQIHGYHVYIEYYFFIQSFEEAYHYATKWVQHFHHQEELKNTHLDYYIRGLNYLLIAQYKLNKYREFVDSLKDLKSLKNINSKYLNENSKLKIRKYRFIHEFNRLFMTGEFDRGVILIERISSGLENFINLLDPHSRLIMFYKTACLYFGNDDFKKSIIWLNKILNYKGEELREDIHSFARILSLISHYELGNFDNIPFYVRATYRYLLKRQNLQKFQILILNFLKNLKADISQKELIQHFESLRKKLLPLQHNRFEKRAFVYFDIISWLESKIEGKRVMEIIKSKAKKKYQIERIAD